MALLIISPTSFSVKDLVVFMSATNCAQMEINEFASIETLDNNQLDVVFEGLTQRQQLKVIEMFDLNQAKYISEIK